MRTRCSDAIFGRTLVSSVPQERPNCSPDGEQTSTDVEPAKGWREVERLDELSSFQAGSVQQVSKTPKAYAFDAPGRGRAEQLGLGQPSRSPNSGQRFYRALVPMSQRSGSDCHTAVYRPLAWSIVAKGIDPVGSRAKGLIPKVPQGVEMASCSKCGKHPVHKSKSGVRVCRRCGPIYKPVPANEPG